MAETLGKIRIVSDQGIASAIQVAEMIGMERWADSPEVAMMDAGFARYLASVLNEKRAAGLHVDVGSGFGGLLAELWKLQRDGVCLGVDANQHNLQLGTVLMGEKSVPVVQYGGVGLLLDGEDEPVRLAFDLLPGEKVDLDLPGVKLVSDDIRYCDVMKKILGKRKISSGSFTFPGFAESLMLDWTGEGRSFTHEKIVSVMEEVRHAAFLFMEKHLEDGGRFLIADRFLVDASNARKIMPGIIGRYSSGNNGKYWDLESPIPGGFVDLGLPDEEGNYRLERVGPKKSGPDAVRKIVWFMLTRNSKKFDED